MNDITDRLIKAGYRPEGGCEAGQRFRRDNFTVYISGHWLFFMCGDHLRSFPTDKLENFSVRDMEWQTAYVPRPRLHWEPKEGNNYEILRRF